MKYQLKDYPEFRQKVKEMTVTELLHVVLCPNIVDDSDSWLLEDSVALFFHIASDEVLKGRIAAAKANSTLPKLIITDVEQGAGFLEHGTKFPSMRACGEAGDEQLAYEMGKISALETRALGFNWGLGPCVDIVANADNPIVGNRAPGKDLETVARIGKAVIAGMQENGLIAVAKHFPGDGYCTFDQHLTTAVNPLSEAEWRSTFGKLYRELIDAGVRSIMPGHISLPSMDQPDPETGICRPATLSHYLMTTLLKEELGFEGIIISDAVNMGGFCGYMERYRAYAEFLEAGGDLLLFAKATEECLNGMMQQVTNGTLRRETLEDRAYRVLCFAKEHERENETLAYDPVEHQRIADLIAQKGMKIGRDRYGVLPFKKSTDLRILYNIICWNGRQKLDEEMIAQLSKHASTLNVIEDAGPDATCEEIRQGNYDLVVCRVAPLTGYGINTPRLSGVLARNMMMGWQKMGTPVVFVTDSNSLGDEYEMAIDTLINMNGYEKNGYSKRMAEFVVNKIFAE